MRPLWLAAFTQRPVRFRLGCRTHPDFIPFSWLNTIPLCGHLIDPVISGRTFRVVPLYGSCEQPGVHVHARVFVYRVFSFLSGTRLGVESLGQAVTPQLTAQGPPKPAPGRSDSTVAKAASPGDTRAASGL